MFIIAWADAQIPIPCGITPPTPEPKSHSALAISIYEMPLLTGLMPSNDIQQAKADMFSEAVYDLENAMVRAIVQPEPDRKVTRQTCQDVLLSNNITGTAGRHAQC